MRVCFSSRRSVCAPASARRPPWVGPRCFFGKPWKPGGPGHRLGLTAAPGSAGVHAAGWRLQRILPAFVRICFVWHACRFLRAGFVAAPTFWWRPGVSLEYHGDPGDRGATLSWPAAPVSVSTKACGSETTSLTSFSCKCAVIVRYVCFSLVRCRLICMSFFARWPRGGAHLLVAPRCFLGIPRRPGGPGCHHELACRPDVSEH